MDQYYISYMFRVLIIIYSFECGYVRDKTKSTVMKTKKKKKNEKWCSPSPLFTAPIALIMPTPDDKEEGNNYLPQYHVPGTCPYFRQAPDLVKAPLPLCLPSH